MNNMKEKRKVAVVSGGIGGVGRAVCTQLAQDGFDVVALYLRTSQEEAENFMKTLASGNHRAIQCDIREPDSVERVFAEILQAHGEIYACVHAAVDPILRKDLLLIDNIELKNELETAFIGGFNIFKCAVPSMKRLGEGRIIGILSRYIFTNTAHKKMGGYLLAKHALRGLLRELYLELVATKIMVTAIAPEFLDTKLSADLPEEVREFIKTRGVYGSMRNPKDVAGAVSFLCSKKGSGMNGKIFSPEESDIVSL